MLDNFMRQLSKDLQMDDPFEAVRPGIYEYWIEEDTVILISTLTPFGFTLSSVLGPYPKDKEDDFFLSMMAGNLFGKETFGATLGLDGNGHKMVLSREIDRRVNYPEFKEILEDFFHIATFWREQAGLIKKEVSSP
ncbi:MAG: type III secretion system chaperone [Parachlamydiaceae bacterium]|nr:type III secretion system chaperone [Parachlamydiaceae bacterium]